MKVARKCYHPRPLGRAAGPQRVPLAILTAALSRLHNAAASYFQGYYLSFLARNGEPTGVAFWFGLLQTGSADQQVIAGFLGSPEFYGDSA